MNAFYGGALTMFFSSPPNPPFSSVREGLMMYPKWKMTLPDGQLILTDYLAKEIKDPPYVEFYERAEKPGQVQ